MVKTFPQKPKRASVVSITQPAMEREEIDLADLLGCCKREVAFRERVYPKWVSAGRMTQAKAERELQLMQQCLAFIVHCIFKATIRRQARTVVLQPKQDDASSG